MPGRSTISSITAFEILAAGGNLQVGLGSRNSTDTKAFWASLTIKGPGGHARSIALSVWEPQMMTRSIQVLPGRSLKATEVFDTFWKFAAKRQQAFISRVNGNPPPWTYDSIIAQHRFTNVYRASDRVSQYLIKQVLYSGDQTPVEVVFRSLLFKFFNKIETWEELVKHLGQPTWSEFRFKSYARVLDRLMTDGQRVYSAAYIMPSPPFRECKKHRNHLRLLECMMKNAMPQKIESAKSLGEVFRILRSYPSIGDFLAYQYSIDLNYSSMVNYSEMEFVVAGPGAKRGIAKCFKDTAGLDEPGVIAAVADMAAEEFRRLGLSFATLWGRPLQLIDIQNLFCEVDKYARIAHPEYNNSSGRNRIKQRYRPRQKPLTNWYPPKWNLVVAPNDLPSKTRETRQDCPGAYAFA